MVIQVRARYNNRPKIGLIRTSKIQNNKPIEYQLQLFDEAIGTIKPSKILFTSISLAIGHASLYGFSTNGWDIEEKEI